MYRGQRIPGRDGIERRIGETELLSSKGASVRWAFQSTGLSKVTSGKDSSFRVRLI
jgi:hypothetical protein